MAGPATATVRAKLPKLEVGTFGETFANGRSFGTPLKAPSSRTRHWPRKINFRGLLIVPARPAIAGFALTSANYKAAIELLKKRYGKQQVIQRTYMNGLLNVEPI